MFYFVTYDSVAVIIGKKPFEMGNTYMNVQYEERLSQLKMTTYEMSGILIMEHQ